jgi:hypothetical protein
MSGGIYGTKGEKLLLQKQIKEGNSASLVTHLKQRIPAL